VNGFVAAPGNQDVQFRRIHERILATGHPPFKLDVVGRFDPEQLPGFSSGSRVPLAAYAPPVARPADLASGQALGGTPLLPSMNLGGYIQQPPFLLTTLESLRLLTNSHTFLGANQQAPISVIRVRVKGVTGPDP
jgi:hypothetical protein